MEAEIATQEPLKIPTDPLPDFTSLTPDHDVQFKVKVQAENPQQIAAAPCSIKISYTSYIYTTNVKFDENKEYELRLGINYEKETLNDVVVEGWDMVLKSGKVQVGDKVEIVCGPKYGYGEEGNDDKKVGKSEWLRYEMKVLEAKEEEKTKWDYTQEQRKELAIEWKSEANQLFKNGDLEKASEIYKKALDFIEDENDEQCKIMKQQLIGNLAFAAFKTKNWQECITKAGEVLAEEKGNVKALFRRGMSYIEINELDKAKADLEEAFKLDKANKEIAGGLQKVLQKLKAEKQKEKKVFSNMFSEAIFVDEKKEELVVVEEPAQKPAESKPQIPNPVVYFDVTIGEKPAERLEFELFANKVPKTAENFRCLCTGEKGLGSCGKPLHYKNVIFHRLIKDFMIQGGDFENENGTGGESIYGKKFNDENFQMKHTGRGLLSMANSGQNTNGSQFFITFKNAEWLDGKHMVFGKLIKGHEFLNEIEKVETNPGDVPKQQIKIVDCGEIKMEEPRSE